MALTQSQKNLVIEAMNDDIVRRRVGENVVIQELIEYLFRSKAYQKSELLRIVTAYKTRKQDIMTGFDAEALASKTQLETKITELTAVETELASL